MPYTLPARERILQLKSLLNVGSNDSSRLMISSHLTPWQAPAQTT
uniref:Uncharacterized protein n=1 Tax=Moniliophthora roreri TaxID=221103 RepID=A0A0W0FE75_MONRR